MSAADIIQPLGIVLGLVVGVAILYFVVTTIKGRLADRGDQ